MTDRLDPIAACDRVNDHYKRYLRSTFQVSDPALRSDVANAITTVSSLTAGPYIQALPPFEKGGTLRDLVDRKVLQHDFLDVAKGGVPIDRPLYRHQQNAVEKVIQGKRNVLVATGTGSGKTETFLYPILNALLEERTAGTLRPGVRALLLYPMNALANDQIRRIRQLLSPFPEITFGRYVGDTPDTTQQAEAKFRKLFPGEPRLRNELIARDEMRITPPHVLLTNFSMLEYLLLRTSDLSLFQSDPTTWRLLVLDEVHVYNGAKATEVGMLLRRVKERVFGGQGDARLQCIATSATLGGPGDHAKVAAFATKLFGEPFEWSTETEARRDVVSAVRESATAHQVPDSELDEHAYPRMVDLINSGRALPEVVSQLAAIGGLDQPDEMDVSHALASLLSRDKRFVRFASTLRQNELTLLEVATGFFPETGRAGMNAALALGARARFSTSDQPLLQGRFHLMLRALDGAFACCDPEHVSGTTRVALDRNTWCPQCSLARRQVRMFELGACRYCSATYVVGTVRADGGASTLELTGGANVARDWFLLDDGISGDDDEDAEAADDGVPPVAVAGAQLLCPRCGEIHDLTGATCGCSVQPRRIVKARLDDDEGRVAKCLRCSGRRTVSRFEGGADAPLTVIATDVYQSVPADSALQNFVPGEGRKLLSFADSRQDAAYFARFFDRTYRRSVQRALVLRGLSALQTSAGTTSFSLTETTAAVARVAEREGIALTPGETNAEAAARGWMLSEALVPAERIGLEGSGLLRVDVVSPVLAKVPSALVDAGFQEEEAAALIQELLSTLRGRGTVALPPGMTVREIEFPGVLTAMRPSGSGKGVLSWMPASKRTNQRTDYLERIVAKGVLRRAPEALLLGIWEYLKGAQVLSEEANRRDGVVYRLLPSALRFSPGRSCARWQCSDCQRITYRTVRDVCPTFRCGGVLRAVVSPEVTIESKHYASLYTELAPIPAEVQEHTANLDTTNATDIQQRFISGGVNVLSCSTTFELGVDVGEVQAVLMRNVPPSPANYVQRAGRAGRRADGTAIVVTFAQRRNHDRYFFGQPERMMKGVITPPAIKLENATIVRRHLHSIAFAMFQRQTKRTDHKVADFFLSDDGSLTGFERFADWLRSRPDELAAAIRTALVDVPELIVALGVDDWAWADRLLDDDLSNPDAGWIVRAAEEAVEDSTALTKLRDEFAAAQNFAQAERCKRTLATIRGRELLGYLGSRNVLPKYGFPTDVVEMNLRTPDAVSDTRVQGLELTRDLQLAIAEYAPGSQVVAGKEVWQGAGLQLRRDKALRQFAWMVCDQCGAYTETKRESTAITACACGAPTSRRNSGEFVVPIFGFVGVPVETRIDARPKRAGFAESYFAGDASVEQEWAVHRLGTDSVAMETRTSPSGRITVLNQGPKGLGFSVCDQCGFAEPFDSRARRRGDHPVPGNKNRKCRHTLSTKALGHSFMTDVMEIRPSTNLELNEALSTLQALVAGATSIGIPNEDIDGVLHKVQGSNIGFVIYDTVPGGAGHVTSLANRISDLVRAAHARVSDCACSSDASCYGCIRSYRNQRYHDQLSRGSAMQVLSGMLGRDHG